MGHWWRDQITWIQAGVWLVWCDYFYLEESKTSMQFSTSSISLGMHVDTEIVKIMKSIAFMAT